VVVKRAGIAGPGAPLRRTAYAAVGGGQTRGGARHARGGRTRGGSFNSEMVNFLCRIFTLNFQLVDIIL